MNPALSERLATAHIEDLRRAAARSRRIRLAGDAQQRPLKEPSIGGRWSAWARLRGPREADLPHNTSRDPIGDPVFTPTYPGRPLTAETRRRPGIE